METTTYSRGAIVSGLVFIVLGVLFLLDHLDVWNFRPAYILPILLMGLGLAVLLGDRS